MRAAYAAKMSREVPSEAAGDVWWVAGPSASDVTCCLAWEDGFERRHLSNFYSAGGYRAAVDGLRITRWAVLQASAEGRRLTFAVDRRNVRFRREVEMTGAFELVTVLAGGERLLYRRRV